MLEMMLLPFVACVLLAGIHVHLGFHVLERGVIFVDIALAQIAALGFILAFAVGIPFHTPLSWLFGLTSTLVAAALFAFSRKGTGTLPQEAVIGMVYVVCAAAAVLVLSASPKDSEHLKHMLVGNILFVTWPEVFKMFGIYAVVGLLHGLFRKRFWAVSRDPEGASRSGVRVPLWDFLFYGTFGIVVTSSVEIAGVLMVFAFLIMPTAASVLLVQGTARRLFLGWGLAVGMSALALAVSYRWDLPTGPAVVAGFGGLVLGAALLRPILSRKT